MSDIKTQISNDDCLALWKQQKVHEKWQKRDAKPFILHDGPPYANGEPHMGHALGQIFKDAVNKFKAMEGYAVNFICGWDCKGLPIEARAEKEFYDEGLKRSQVDPNELRLRCRDIASYYIDVQQKSFESMGVLMNDNIYTTMQHQNELNIVRVIHDFARKGLIYRDFKPVLWSCEEGTSLAAAEIEYKDKISTSVYVIFKIIEAEHDLLQDAYIPIWTTTPWSLPMNQAIAYNPDMHYVIIDTNKGRMIVASNLLESFTKDTNNHITEITVVTKILGNELGAMRYHYSLSSREGFYQVVPSCHVMDDMGTGFVHMAIDHGEDDFKIGKELGLKCLNYINEDGYFSDATLPEEIQGKFYSDTNNDIIKILSDSHSIIGIQQITHSYPHSWRSRKPVIYRAAKQWFIDLKNENLNLIDRVYHFAHEIKWMPEKSKQRFVSILQSRQEWCISRRRAWGTPIALFYDKNDNIIIDEEVLKNTVDYLSQHGVDSWWSENAQKSVIDEDIQCRPIHDIIDVWMDSGSTWTFLPEYIQNDHGIDLLFEGSDQHRAWFQSGRLVDALYNTKSTVKAIKTHGYVTDTKGRKMSKSLGNGIDPQELMDNIGPDGLRLWALRQDVSQDVSYDHAQQKDISSLERKIINTIKFIVNHASPDLDDTSLCNDPNRYDKLPLLEKWILYRLYTLDQCLQDIQDQWNIHKLVEALHTFCEHDLSKVYFDIRKDVLYWNNDDDVNKIVVKKCLDTIFNILIRIIAPVMSFAAEKYYHMYHNIHYASRNYESILSSQFIHAPDFWCNDRLHQDMNDILQIRKAINGESEKLRAQKLIKDNKDVAAILYVDSNSPVLTLDTNLIKDVTFAGQINVIASSVKQQNNVDSLLSGSTTESQLLDKVELQILSGNKCSKCKVRNNEVSEALLLDQITKAMLCIRCTKMFSNNNH